MVDISKTGNINFSKRSNNVPRKVSKISQRMIADWLGVSPAHYSLFINKRAGVSLTRLHELSQKSGVSTDDILEYRSLSGRILNKIFAHAFGKRTQP
jgi:predicted transcriptional regulator